MDDKAGATKQADQQPAPGSSATPAIKVTSAMDTPSDAVDTKPAPTSTKQEAEPEIDMQALAERREKKEKDEEEKILQEVNEKLAKK